MGDAGKVPRLDFWFFWFFRIGSSELVLPNWFFRIGSLVLPNWFFRIGSSGSLFNHTVKLFIIPPQKGRFWIP